MKKERGNTHKVVLSTCRNKSNNKSNRGTKVETPYNEKKYQQRKGKKTGERPIRNRKRRKNEKKN
jgi:hypothetical protein